MKIEDLQLNNKISELKEEIKYLKQEILVIKNELNNKNINFSNTKQENLKKEEYFYKTIKELNFINEELVNSCKILKEKLVKNERLFYELINQVNKYFF